MRILIVVGGLSSIYGGTSRIVIDWSKALSKQGIKVDIVTTNAHGTEKLLVDLDTWIVEAEGYRIRYFSFLPLGDYKPSIDLDRWLWRNIMNYDLVHTVACFSLPVLSAYRACQYHNIPYIVNPQGTLDSWALQHKAWKKKIYLNWIEKPFLKRAACLHTLTQKETKSCINLGLSNKITQIPNGIWLEENHNIPSDYFFENYPHLRGKRIILFLGRIDPKKGLDILVPAFREVVNYFPDTSLVIAGPDNIGYKAKIEKLINSNNLHRHVEFTGHLHGNLKRSALSAASIYVSPSYSEGFSMSILEGMASALPCIITEGCNFPEAAQAQAAHVVLADQQSLTKALTYCLSDPDAANAMGQRAQKLVCNNYSWPMIGSQIQCMYTEVLKAKALSNSEKSWTGRNS